MAGRDESRLSQDEAIERLSDAVDNIASVQDNYELTDEQMAYLKDAKSSVAAVVFHL